MLPICQVFRTVQLDSRGFRMAGARRPARPDVPCARSGDKQV